MSRQPESPTRRAASLSLFGAAWACVSQSRSKGGRVLPAIELSISLKRTEVISGESLALLAVVTNRGPEPVEIQTSPHVPITYEFRAQDGEVRYRTSQQAYGKALTAGLQLPPESPSFTRLEPGQLRRLHQDPALYLLAGLAPGRYVLAARMPAGAVEIEAAPLEIQVTAARLRSLASLYCPYQNAMVNVFDHTDAAGASWVFFRETISVQLPAGVAVRVCRAEKGVEDVAAAFHVAPRLEGRWLAWAEDGALCARKVWGGTVMTEVAPVALALGQPRLTQPGFQMADGSGVFLAAGTAEGRARVQIVKVTPQGAGASAPAALYQSLPERVLARWQAGGPEPVIQLVWADRAGEQTRVFVRAYNLAGKTLAAGPKQIHARAARLLALELDPLGEEPGWAHALFEAQQPKEGPVYVRIPLSGAPARPEEFRVPAPPKPASDWAISGLETGGLLVLARIEDRIWVASARGRDWEPLTGPVGEIQRLRLAASTRDYWGALWVDPASGLRCVSDPAFRARA